MAILYPDSEGGWICGKHRKERRSQKYGSNCYCCVKAEKTVLEARIKLALKELEHILGIKTPTEIRIEQALKGK